MVETRSMKRSRIANTGSSTRVIEDDHVTTKRKKENSSSSSSSSYSSNSSGSFEEEDENKNEIDYFGVDGLNEEERVWNGMFSASDISMVSLHPDEYTNIPLTDEERRCYESPEYKALPPTPDYSKLRWRRNVPKLGCKEYHFITTKEASIYGKAVKKSQGFDLAFLPYSIMRAGMITPVLIHQFEDDAQEMARYSKLALRHYNKKNGTEYDFKRLVKANAQSACVIAYRITFLANFAAYPNEQDTTFQAKVLLKLRNDIEILLCRIKPCW